MKNWEQPTYETLIKSLNNQWIEPPFKDNVVPEQITVTLTQVKKIFTLNERIRTDSGEERGIYTGKCLAQKNGIIIPEESWYIFTMCDTLWTLSDTVRSTRKEVSDTTKLLLNASLNHKIEELFEETITYTGFNWQKCPMTLQKVFIQDGIYLWFYLGKSKDKRNDWPYRIFLADQNGISSDILIRGYKWYNNEDLQEMLRTLPAIISRKNKKTAQT